MKKERPKLYEKLPNGRYQEWHEPERPEVDNALYRRIGKKYVPVNMQIEVNSWQEGVFAVTRVHSSLYPDSWTNANYLQEIFRLYRCGDIEKVSISRLGGMHKLADHLTMHWNEVTGANTYERCASIVAILMNYREE